MESSLGMFAGLIALTMGMIELLKKKFDWVDGKEEFLAVFLPMALAAAAKLAGCPVAFVQASWVVVLGGALVAGLVAQFGHDKLWDPVLKPAWAWVMKKFGK